MCKFELRAILQLEKKNNRFLLSSPTAFFVLTVKNIAGRLTTREKGDSPPFLGRTVRFRFRKKETDKRGEQ